MKHINVTYGDFCRYRFYMERWRVPRWGMFVILPFFLSAATLRSLHPDLSTVEMGNVVVAMLWVLLITPVWPMLLLVEAHQAQAYSRRNGMVPFHFAANETGVTISQSNAKHEIKWPLFRKIVETNSMFLLFGPGTAVMLPKRELPDVPGLRNVIQSHFTGKKRLK